MVQQRKIAKYVLLQIVTLGIYGLFFWSDWTEDVNKMCEDDNKESANYIFVFILDIFTFGVFSLIWNYSMSERMYRIAPKYGIELKYGGSRVLLLRTILFFLPVFGSVAKLKMFNTLAVAYNATLDEEEIVLSTMKEKKPKKETKAEKKASKKATKKGTIAEVTAPVVEAVAPVAEAVAPVAEEVEPVTEAVQFNEIEVETIDVPTAEEVEFSEPVYEIADIDIPDIKFAEAPVEIETVDEIEFTEPAAYEISTDIADVAFIDDEPLAPASKEDVLKQATKTVGNKRTVKEKVAKEPAAKKSTKAAEEKAVKATKTAGEKATKSTKTKKETATKSTAKKETAKKETAKKETAKKETAKKETKPKTTKAAKEKAKKEVEKIVDEVKIDDLTFGEITFEEVNLEADILNEIAEISKSKK